jgi:hypothetical protein
MIKGLLATYKEFQERLIELLAEDNGKSEEAEILFAEATDIWLGLSRSELDLLQRRRIDDPA